MNFARIFYLTRKWIAVTCVAFSTGGFYGTLAAILVQYGFNISEEESMLYAGLPVALFGVAFMWPRLPKILGFDDVT